MNMTDLYGDFAIPSNRSEILSKLINLKVIEIYKCAFYSYEEYQKYLAEVNFPKTDRTDYFKFVDGQYLFKFSNGWEVAFVYDEELYSLTLGFQKDNSSIISSYIFNDVDVKCFLSIEDVYEKFYIDKILNTRIKKIEILSLKNIKGKKIGLPNENGIKLIFDTNHELILSLGLIKNNSTFSLLDYHDIDLNDSFIKDTYE
jgi:hypothetical protein